MKVADAAYYVVIWKSRRMAAFLENMALRPRGCVPLE
jgi:hypothetical protein